MHRLKLFTLLLLLAALCVLPASGQETQYAFKTIDVPFPHSHTFALGINDSGNIVGNYHDLQGYVHGFLLRGSTFTSIEFPGAPDTELLGINTYGQIVGNYTTHCPNGYGCSHPFVLSGGVFTPLPEVPGSVPGTTVVTAINSSGQVVGNFGRPDGSKSGFLLSGGEFTLIGGPELAFGINDSGVVVGFAESGTCNNDFSWRDGVFTPIIWPAGPWNAWTTAINNLGQVVGTIGAKGYSSLFLMGGGTIFAIIDVPDATDIDTYSPDINNKGQIVGTYYAWGGAHGFLATPIPANDTAGPISSNVAVNLTPLPVNFSAMLTASIDDSTTGGRNIVSATYTINGASPTWMYFWPLDAVAVWAEAPLPSFSQSNVYDICVHGTDAAGNSGADTCILLPVYDPTGGFVTGGGSIPSAIGADLINTSASGPATFGFVSKYLSGVNWPSVNLMFQFKAGSLTFKSTSMDWLVVTGEPRAMFRGTGMVNGMYTCQFQVDTWDNSFPSGTGEGVDAFGIRIHSCDGGGNANGNRYSIDPTPLSGGSIIIHR